MLHCAGDRIYTGITPHLIRRYREHQSGPQGARFTRGFPPQKVLQCWRLYGSRGLAQRIEHFIKKHSHLQKLAFADSPHTLVAAVKTQLQVKTGLYCFSAERINEILDDAKSSDNQFSGLAPGDYP